MVPLLSVQVIHLVTEISPAPGGSRGIFSYRRCHNNLNTDVKLVGMFLQRIKTIMNPFLTLLV